MPDNTNTPGRGVFLSYAREDTGAAQLIAEALRRAGVEAWFDQSELRGGDTWDQKIRRQIKDCGLFIPIISATTQARAEGYFRREWRQAADRTRDMASGVAFILPVVIDETKENDALVPEEFMHVQWMRLPEALPTPQFTKQVKALLESPRRAAVSSSTTAPTAPAPAAKKSSTGLIAIAVAVVALAGIGAWLWQSRQAAPAPTTVAAESKPAAPVAAVAADKSVAVLPFANMSEDKDAGFFADGVHEDLLTNLAMISQLKVISRTSVMQYRDTKKTIRQIGQELGVAYVLEGSVRRAGNQVRITGQLIDTRNDEHVWAKAYDRNLTDIFSIQSALAQEIAGALSAAISPETQKHLDRRPTENVAAYDLFLKARDVYNRSPTASPTALQKTEEMYQAVVDLDPKFAEAWGELAVIHALNIFWGQDGSAARLAKGEAAIAKAVALAPDNPTVIEDIGTFAYYAHRDYVKAAAQYRRLAELEPNNPQMHRSLGLILRRQGHWAESLVAMRRGLELEPANLNALRTMFEMYIHARRWDEARATQRRVIALMPDSRREELALWGWEALITGSTAGFEKYLAKLTPAEREEPVVRYFRKGTAVVERDWAEFKRLDELQPEFEDEEEPVVSAIVAGCAYWGAGDTAAAARRVAPFVESARARVEREPDNPVAISYWAQVQALGGHAKEALATIQTAMRLIPVSNDAMDGPNYVSTYLEILAIAGEDEKVLAELPGLFQLPLNFPPASYRDDPCFARLRDNPRFKAILDDPASNKAPLF